MANELKKIFPKKKDPSGQPSMKWYAFLKDLGLYLYAIFVALLGYFTIIGLFLTDGAEKTKEYGQDYLIIADIVFCVLLLALAVYAVVIRFSLNKFKAKAPMLLLILHGVDAAVNLGQLVVYEQVDPKLLAEMNVNYKAGTSLWMVIGGVALIFINRIYFQKRKEFFKN